MANRRGVTKRRPELPKEAHGILSGTSKAELLEVAWALAGLANEAGSVDDHESTRERLLQEINLLRAARGARPLKIDDPTAVRRRRLEQSVVFWKAHRGKGAAENLAHFEAELAALNGAG